MNNNKKAKEVYEELTNEKIARQILLQTNIYMDPSDFLQVQMLLKQALDIKDEQSPNKVLVDIDDLNNMMRRSNILAHVESLINAEKCR